MVSGYAYERHLKRFFILSLSSSERREGTEKGIDYIKLVRHGF